ncbi:LysR family transcriptional regulator [Tabrizicola sp. BL-A-41-H6]|uniref:LysR family transcriptional regulator n=1 Tax=Tabrizicola sp. BL-A-41-H6 TaxID=3421107 RepID=UPI003D677F1C
MDIALLKTFLTVSETGSFIAASERLHVTQSAVSLRVQRLEEMLGQPLFLRAKTGTELTPGGRAFTSHATALLQTWERARQEISAAEGRSRTLVIGAEAGLWPGIGFRWLAELREARDDLSLRGETGSPTVLARAMAEGEVQACLTYGPLAGAGLRAERIAEDELVLVAAWPKPSLADLHGRYVNIDWGPQFRALHAGRLELAEPALSLDTGCPALPLLLQQGLSAYLPMTQCAGLIATERLAVVPDAPRMAQEAWAVWRESLEEDLTSVARTTLLAAVRDAETTGIGADAADDGVPKVRARQINQGITAA